MFFAPRPYSDIIEFNSLACLLLRLAVTKLRRSSTCKALAGHWQLTRRGYRPAQHYSNRTRGRCLCWFNCHSLPFRIVPLLTRSFTGHKTLQGKGELAAFLKDKLRLDNKELSDLMGKLTDAGVDDLEVSIKASKVPGMKIFKCKRDGHGHTFLNIELYLQFFVSC